MPVPKVADVEDLNDQLLEGCREDALPQIAGHPDLVGIADDQRAGLAPGSREGWVRSIGGLLSASGWNGLCPGSVRTSTGFRLPLL